MSQARIDMFGVGNALLDVEYRISEAFLREHNIEKRHMTLVDADRMLFLIDALASDAVTSTCGGSVANTMYAMRGFGRKTHLACRVANDDAGRHFVAQLNDAGISTNKILSDRDGVTGRCLVMITEDAERTMNTCLGVSEWLLPAQIEVDTLARASAVYVEGYLASSATGHRAAKQAREVADEHGLETNLTLADTSMVKSFRTELESIIGNGLTRVICNSEEALEWCQTDRLDIALTQLRDIAGEVVITLGPNGCAINNGKERINAKAFNVEPMDLNGAGDMFAAAYLTAISEWDAVRAARFANFAASHVIQFSGARLASIPAYESVKRAYQKNLETESEGQARVSLA